MKDEQVMEAQGVANGNVVPFPGTSEPQTGAETTDVPATAADEGAPTGEDGSRESGVGSAEVLAAAAADPLVETSYRYVCEGCGHENNPTDPTAKCASCGRHAPIWDARAKVYAAALQTQMGDPRDVENIERADNGLKPIAGKPADQALPLRGVGKDFDAYAAFEDLHKQRLVVEANQRDFDELSKRTKAAKGRLDEAQEYFNQLFDSYYTNKQKSELQPGLRFEGDDAADGVACEIERVTGAPCPACQSQRAKGVPAEPGDPLHPAHPQHVDVAKALLIKDRDALVAQLQQKHFYITAGELGLLDVNDLQILQRFGAQRGKVPPPLLTKAHIAAAAGADRQECKRCGIVLLDRENFDEGIAPYPALVAVGLDCPGTPADAIEELPPAEPARQPKAAHVRKDKRQKRDPEAERAEQKKAGRQAAVGTTTKKTKKAKT